MFSIYISASALANAYLQEGEKLFEEQSEWFKILRKQTVVFTYGYVPTDGFDVENGLSVSHTIEEFGQAYEILVQPADEYISQILDNNQKVLDHPNAAFFLDIEAEKAQDIQSQYGVICQATDSIDSKVFTKSCIGTNLVKDQETKKGWESILKIPTELPSNSLCIVDRFLFAEDGKNNFGYNNTIGFDNISLILYYALPNSFNDEYHITIITDRNNIQNGIQTMSDKLIRLVNILAEKKGYPIKLEFLAIDVNNKAMKYTQPFIHNRQIFSNYYHINFPNGVNILYFKEGKGFAKYNQFIRGTLLYNDSLDYIASDPIISVIESYRRQFKDIIIDWKAGKDVGYYSYADNRGNHEIKNLELTHFS